MATGIRYEYQSDFARRHRAQGRAEGRAEGMAAAVLTVLDARGVEVPTDARTRVTDCPTSTSSTPGFAERPPSTRSTTCSTDSAATSSSLRDEFADSVVAEFTAHGTADPS